MSYVARILQDEPEMVRKALTKDTEARLEVRELIRDLASLFEVIVDEAAVEVK